jgi:hypothetical protein
MTKRGHTSSDFSFEFENDETPFIRIGQYHEENIDEEPQEASSNNQNEEYYDLVEVPFPEIENEVPENPEFVNEEPENRKLLTVNN